MGLQKRRIRRSWEALLGSAALACIIGCTWNVVETNTVTTSSTVSLCLIPEVVSFRSVAGLFVGIGNVDDPSVFDTPAHGLGAAVSFEPFYHAFKNGPDVAHNLRLVTDLEPPKGENPVLDRNLTTALGKLHGFGFGTKALLSMQVDGTELSLESDSRGLAGEVAPQQLQITTEKLRSELAFVANSIEHMLATEELVLLVAYISAHGLISDDGRSYFVAADSDPNQPASMMSFQEFVEEVVKVMNRHNTEDRQRVVATIFFDACRENRTGAEPLGYEQLPFGLIVFESASPGEWVWHWSGVDTWETSGETSERSIGSLGLRNKQPVNRRGIPIESKMSALPIAQQMALLRSQHFAARQGWYDQISEHSGYPVEELADYIFLDDWLFLTAPTVRSVLDRIPKIGGEIPEQTIRSFPEELEASMQLFYAPDQNPYFDD